MLVKLADRRVQGLGGDAVGMVYVQAVKNGTYKGMARNRTRTRQWLTLRVKAMAVRVREREQDRAGQFSSLDDDEACDEEAE